MRFLFIGYIFIILQFISCKGKDKTDSKEETTVSSIQKESPGKPKIDIKVNKHYDKSGNLISFDSTYSSYYSNFKFDKLAMDSMIREFKSDLNDKFPLMRDKNLNLLFFNDSLIYYDFYYEDFFRKRFELNMQYLKQMFYKMDSVKNAFFNKNHRDKSHVRNHK